MSKALEAAWNDVMAAKDMPADDDPGYDRWLFEAAISAYLAHLAEDEAVVERASRGYIESICKNVPARLRIPYDQMDPEDQTALKDNMRAALRTLAGKE